MFHNFTTFQENAENHFFTLIKNKFPHAHTVHIAGSFNDWLNATDGKIDLENPELKSWQMRRDRNGDWYLPKKLPQGNFEYKFIIDTNKWYPEGGPEANMKLTLPSNELIIQSPYSCRSAT